MELDIGEPPPHETEAADISKLVVTGMSDDGYEATQTFMNHTEIAGTDEGTSSVGLQRVRQSAESHVKIFNCYPSNSLARSEKVHQRDDSTLGVCER